MSLKKIKFEDKEVNKKEFFLSKQAIPLDSVDLSSVKWGLLTRSRSGFFRIFNHVKTIKND